VIYISPFVITFLHIPRFANCVSISSIIGGGPQM